MTDPGGITEKNMILMFQRYTGLGWMYQLPITTPMLPNS